MREVLKTSRQWLRTGWILPLALLALPNCILDTTGYDVDHEFAFDPGTSPTGAIVCDYPKPSIETAAFDCATPEDLEDGAAIDMAEAAIALVEGRNFSVALDYSQSAIDACGGPRRIEFLEGEYPIGDTLCLNCGQIPQVYASAAKACMAKCEDLVWAQMDGIVDEAKWCAENAKVSTNFGSTCQNGVCSTGGNAPSEFDHPRKHQEPVEWTDTDGAEAFDAGNNLLNSLRRTADTSGPLDSDFNAGAASLQLITEGDAWVEFEAGEDQTTLSHVIGLRGSCNKISDCKDEDHGLTGIGFALSLNNDGNVYVLEQGNPLIVVPIPNGYTGGERFRVRVTDKHNGFAEISYYRVASGCVDGTPCTTQLLHTSPTLATYPLRVDAIFREKDSSLVNVTMVYIKKQ